MAADKRTLKILFLVNQPQKNEKKHELLLSPSYTTYIACTRKKK